MGKTWVREFMGGLDVRRMPETTAGGVLIRAVDGHINRGGEFEQRAAFVKVYTLPAGATKGLAATASSLFVFGEAAAPTLPTGVLYQRLQAATASPLAKVLSTTLFQGNLFVAARFASGVVHNFFNGTRITNWPSLPFGTSVKTVARKVYAVSGPNLLFSALGDATAFNSGIGFGFIDMSTQATGSEELIALAGYQNYLAVFAGRTIQIEAVDPDPTLNRIVQVLKNTGTIAPRSVTEFGDNDVFYLDRSGVRSLRARSAINVAFSSDIGNPIDDLIIAKMQTLTAEERANVIGVIEPSDGRLWIALKDEIFVFSYYIGSKISAWTTYRTGFNIDDMVEFDGKVFLRSGDDIYCYGGLGDTPVYDDTEAEAWLPYLDANSPTQIKRFLGLDIAARGVWEVSVSFDPIGGASDKVAVIDGTTYGLNTIGGIGEATHISLRLKVKARPDSGPAKLASVVIHHDLDDDED